MIVWAIAGKLLSTIILTASHGELFVDSSLNEDATEVLVKRFATSRHLDFWQCSPSFSLGYAFTGT